MGSSSASVARGFLFADLRNYSAWVERHGDHAAARLLRDYRTVVRAAVAEFHGAEIRTEGDSFYVAFGSPSAAVNCGLRIVELARASDAGDGAPIRVGVGVHAGETVETDEGYVGSAVNIAARVCGQAGAGEVLVSDAVRSMTRTFIDAKFTWRGRKRLKGISEPIGLYHVERMAADARQGVLRPTWGASRSLRRIAAVAIPSVVLAGALAGALIGGALMSEEGAVQDLGPSSALQPTAPAETPALSPIASESSTSAFPTDGEARLLGRLDDGVARLCRRADPADVPTYEDDAGGGFGLTTTIPLAHNAGLECVLGGPEAPDTVWYWSAIPGQRHEMVSGIYFQAIGRRSIPPGDCATEDPAYGRWEFGASQGGLLCYGSRNATLMWTYDDENLLATAVRSDGDMRALYSWWRDHARLLGSP